MREQKRKQEKGGASEKGRGREEKRVNKDTVEIEMQ